MTGKLEQLCLSKNARHRGTVTLAGVVTCDNYVEHETEHKEKIRVDILVAANVNVPVRAFTRGQKPEDDHVSEYWNFKESVHHDAFLIPTICTTDAVHSEAKPLTGKQIRNLANPLNHYV